MLWPMFTGAAMETAQYKVSCLRAHELIQIYTNADLLSCRFLHLDHNTDHHHISVGS
jgi:hypothetical protein